MNYLDFACQLLPELIVLLTALGLVGVSCSPAAARLGRRVCGAITLAGLSAALVALFWLPVSGGLPDGIFVHDSLTRLFKAVLLLLTGGTVLLMGEGVERRSDISAESRALLLLALIGLMAVVGTENLLVIFIGLELASITLYMMVAFSAPGAKAAGAALNYFFFGSVAAAFLLYGMSLLFGVSGSIDLRVIAVAVGGAETDPVLLAALAMILVGFGFKVAAVPFHLWAPGVYQEAPAPVAGFIASGSKIAGFFILAKFMTFGLAATAGSADWGGFGAGWVPLVAVVAALSMVVGNLGALVQPTVSRIMAFSGIGHSGFILAALAAADGNALRAVLFYSIIYGLANLVAFGVIGRVRHLRGGDRVEDFAGLAKESPLAAGALALSLLSLAGLPPLAGFFGKFQLFAVTLGGGIEPLGRIWLVALALMMSAVSLFYYLRILKVAFFIDAGPAMESRFATNRGTDFVLVVCSVLLVLLGLFPEPILQVIEVALVGSGG